MARCAADAHLRSIDCGIMVIICFGITMDRYEALDFVRFLHRRCAVLLFPEFGSSIAEIRLSIKLKDLQEEYNSDLKDEPRECGT